LIGLRIFDVRSHGRASNYTAFRETIEP
jgi:hypothetical protein